MLRSKLFYSVAFGAVLLAGVPVVTAHAQELTFEETGTLGGDDSEVIDISSDGSVLVGDSRTAGGHLHAFRWVGGVMTDLGTLGGDDSEAKAVSSDGSVVVGDSETAGGNVHAFRWVGGVMTDLGTLGGNESEAIDISSDGSVVIGNSATAGGHERAFRWVGGVMTDLGTLGGNDSYARALSSDGSVVIGRAAIAGIYQHAFRWEGGVMTDLGTLGGNYSSASALSLDGSVVVGEAETAGGTWHAFRWEGGTITDLGTLGGNYSSARLLSADGSVVAGDAEIAFGTWHAFRWQGGIMTDLGTLGGDGSEVSAMSADGSIIVGQSETSSGDDLSFRWTAKDGMQSLHDILTNAGVDLTGWELAGDDVFISADGSVISGIGDLNGDDRTFIMTMSGLTTPGEFVSGLIPAIGTPTQAMEAMSVSTGQSMTASREAFSSFSSGAFRMSSASLGSSAPSDLNNVATASGPSARPLYDDSRFAGYVIGSTGFAHEHASGDHNVSGTTGMFYRLSDEVAIGAGISGGHTKRELRMDGESRVASYGGNMNIAYEGAEGFRVYGTAGASTLDIEMDRNYMNGAGIDTSKGETGGFSYGAAMQAGYEMPVTDNIQIMPYAAIEASKTKIDGYAETGGAFAATFDERSSSLVTSRVGAEVSIDTGEDMEIRARAAWGHVLSENGDDLSATVINLPQTIAYQEGRKDWIEGGVTFSWQYAESTRLVADIAGRSGKDTDTAATATIGVTFGF